MPARILPRAAATLACLLAGALSACGGSTKTVTVASTPAAQGTTTTTKTASTNTATTPRPVTTTQATSTTHTSSEPAFTEEQSSSQAEGVSAAAALVRAKGFTPKDTSEYHSGQTLRVLTATRTGSGDGYGQQAFFFLDGHYLGTDTKEPSAQLKVVSQSDTEIAISYPLYRHSDPLCCPGGGSRVVHFALNNGKLTALDPIPPASSSSGLSRN